MKIIAAALMVVSLCSASAALASSDERPNVVLIVSDDQAWTDFGFMGHPVIRTPRLDAFASESVVFENGYVPTSLCRASLATLLTGLYPHQHRICTNDPPDGVDRAEMLRFIEQSPTVPRLLQAAGYRSLQTGKNWEGHYARAGFTHGMTTKGRHGEEGLAIGRKTMQPIQDFLTADDPRPFFLWYAPMLPHEPHNPPQRLLKKYAAAGRSEKLAKYYAMCEWFDESCGVLLDAIDDHGMRDNTLVVFVVDNGWIQETGPEKTTRGNFAPKSKLSPHDGGLRTPIMLRWPGRTTPARRQELVSSIDLAPTILSACGATPPSSMPGLNLLQAADEGALEREAVFGELYRHTAVDLATPAKNLTHRWIRRGAWKLIVPTAASQPTELYDVVSDPTEERNLAGAEAARVEQLRAVLDAWWDGR